MNIQDILDRVPTAKRTGTIHKFADVGFEFRELTMTERQNLAKASAQIKELSEDVEKQTEFIVKQIYGLIDVGLLVNWHDLTIAKFEEIAQVRMDFSDEKRQEEIQFDTPKAVIPMLKVMVENNFDFQQFVFNSCLKTAKETEEKEAELKKT